jgi:beta-barrel assembly-enhancing protease
MRMSGAGRAASAGSPVMPAWRGVVSLAVAALAAGGLAGLAGCAGGLPNMSVESLARVGASALPIGPEKEAEIGFGIAAVLAGRFALTTDDGLLEYVNLVGRTVAEQSPRRQEVAFRFGVLETDDVNAFAAPGGFILITRGALAAMEDEAMLAGVLAHEIAHVDQKHVLEEIRRSSVVQSARDEGMLTGALLNQISELGGSLLFTGLSRSDEMEADSLALIYAAAAGYRPDGLARFLERLYGAGSGDGRLRELTATHPSMGDRLAALRRQLQAAGVEAAGGVTGDDRFRARVGARVGAGR